MTRVSGDISLSSLQNSGSHWLVLKTLKVSSIWNNVNIIYRKITQFQTTLTQNVSQVIVLKVIICSLMLIDISFIPSTQLLIIIVFLT